MRLRSCFLFHSSRHSFTPGMCWSSSVWLAYMAWGLNWIHPILTPPSRLFDCHSLHVTVRHISRDHWPAVHTALFLLIHTSLGYALPTSIHSYCQPGHSFLGTIYQSFYPNFAHASTCFSFVYSNLIGPVLRNTANLNLCEDHTSSVLLDTCMWLTIDDVYGKLSTCLMVISVTRASAI